MKKFIIFLVIILILNFTIFDVEQKNKVNAEILVASALSIKLFVCILTCMGVYLATTIDYIKLYEKFQDTNFYMLKQYTDLVKNMLIHRIKLNLTGKYEFIRDFINGLNFDVSNNYTSVKISESKVITSAAIDNYPVGVDLEFCVSDGYVFSVGHVVLKTEKRNDGLYDIYIASIDDGEFVGWRLLAFCNQNLILKVREKNEDYVDYVICYVDEYGFGGESDSGVCVYLDEQLLDVSIPVEEKINIRKSKELVELDNKNIGVYVDTKIGYVYDSLDDLLLNIDSMTTFDDYYLENLRNFNLLKKTQLIANKYEIIETAIEAVPQIEPIPNVEDLPVFGETTGGTVSGEISIPDEVVLDENIEPDTNVPGLGLITRLLRFIANLLKKGILSPLLFIKDAIKDLPSHLANIIQEIKKIPTILENIFTKLGEFLGIKSIIESISSLLIDLKEWVLGIPEIYGKVKEWVEDLFTIPDDLAFEIDYEVDLDLSKFDNVSLKERFPFCIPWDLRRAVSAFAQSARDIDFKIELNTQYFSINEKVDLSIIDPYVAFFRYATIVAFAIFLITKTRDFIKW